MKSVDPKLLALFETEQREHLQTIRKLLDAAGASGVNSDSVLPEILRCAHTLKGAARAVGVDATEVLAHRLESVFVKVREKALMFDGLVVATVNRAMEAIEDALSAVLENRPAPDISPMLSAVDGLLNGEPSRQLESLEQAPLPRQAPVSSEKPVDLIRVGAKSVDDLVNSSSQMLAAVVSQMRVARGVEDLCQSIANLEMEWTRLRRQSMPHLREHPDPALLECLEFADIKLRELTRQSRTINLAQQRGSVSLRHMGTQVHQDACAVRMTPAATVFDPFRKMVRDLAQSEEKEVQFQIEGLEVQADRLVLQQLKDPVMHILRNAISHGIEAPAERVAAGKPRCGLVYLRLEARGGRLDVTIRDDGRGMNFQKIAEVAVRRGLLSPGASSQSPRDLVKLIFEPGFSTARAVTDLEGRGMGLSVVQDRLARLQGEIHVSETGVPGTSIVLSVPLSVSTHHIVLVGCGGHTFGIPSRAIRRLCRIRIADMESVEGRETIRFESQPLAVARLAALLDLPESDGGAENGVIPLVVLHSAGQYAGIAVDALLDEREALVKDLNVPPSGSGMATGAIPLEDGGVAVVLNPLALMERFRQTGRSAGYIAKPPEPAKKIPTILVVDDSITTRSLEKSILEAHGYRVRVAVDGVEALGELRAEPADLVISDVMMPRMDGFQLLERIKKDRELAHIPVIVVTSMEQRQEQERGLSLGADAYIVKRKFDQRELLDTVRQIL